MSKHNRISTREHVSRERQRNKAKFDRWCQKTGQWDKQASLIAYRLNGLMRYRKSGRKGARNDR